MNLTKEQYRELWLTANPHTSRPFFITCRAVRTVIAHAIIVVYKILAGWQPVVVSTIVAYKPYLHIPTSITQIIYPVKRKGLA